MILKEVNKRSNTCKLVIAKAQFLLDILESNMGQETKIQKEALFLKGEGAKVIYEILIGKSFEIDAFEMNNPEIVKLRSDEAISDTSFSKKKPEKTNNKKAFINIFKGGDSISGNQQNYNMKKLPIKVVKKPGTGSVQKAKTIKAINDSHLFSSDKLIHDESTLLSLNHLINFHYILTHVSFKLRGLLTLSEDNLFIYSCYKTEELEYQSHQVYILSKILELLDEDSDQKSKWWTFT